ncbi:hypothetical protein DXG03_007656 [Asterophora parasitica]|uniref:Uncharacterized protein n=1 Tax=Asterophora parasitica TaxID=117018 RepID=A0A9P7G0R0_9AGAR|nr:hypothetical protein DXG03_007656 [Asterophora parasitica]
MPDDDGHPSLLWIVIPPVLLVSAFYIRKWYQARRLRLYGIGKGAPGFQTNVRRVRVTPEIAARIRRGETVSPDEIAQAAAEAEANGNGNEEEDPPRNSLAGRGVVEERRLDQDKSEPGPVNEWLPESITAPKKRAKGKKR